MARKRGTGRLDTTLDRAAVIFDGEHELKKQLRESRSLGKFWRELDELGPLPDARVGLLKQAVRLTPKLAPKLFGAVERCTERLGVKATIEVFCQQNELCNAFVLCPADNRVTVCFTHTILEVLDEDELPYVIGHELGHALFDHHALRRLVLFEDDERLSPADVLRLYAWMRYAELTADRVGLLCTDTLEHAVSGAFKTYSGYGRPGAEDGARAFIEQYASLQAEAIEKSTDDWTATHPLGPLRMRAMDLFHRSRAYKKLTGKGEASLADAALEREVRSLMELMDPSGLDSRSNYQRQIKLFLLYGGMRVASADDRVTRREAERLREIAGERLAEQLDEASGLDAAALDERLSSLTGELTMGLPLLRRRKLIEELCLIALADRHIDDAERQVLLQLALSLGVEPWYPASVLERPTAALD